MHQPFEWLRFSGRGHLRSSHTLLLLVPALLLLSHRPCEASRPAHQSASAATPSYGTPTFPCPPELVPWVTFWLRIFTEFSSTQRVLHDSRYPWVIYEVVDVEGLSPAQATARVQERRAWYEGVLESLALGSHRELNEAQKRVAAIVTAVPDQARYTRARERIRSQTGISDKFRAGLVRSGRYMHEIEAILDSLGVPKEIAYLPHVESSFNARARSRAGAVGMWQFTGPTGRMYLRVEDDLDERYDVPAATEAAGRYLLRAREVLDSWPLALISYNHGINGMRRARTSLGTTDLVRILNEYDGPAFGFASRNFYCEFLAAIEAARRVETCFGRLEYDPPRITRAYRIPQYVKAPALAAAFGLTIRELADLNPALGASYLQGSRAVPKGYRLRLPLTSPDDHSALFVSIPATERSDTRPQPLGYRVRPGDTLLDIARRHRVSVHSIMQINRIDDANRIRAGQVLVIPDPARPGL